MRKIAYFLVISLLLSVMPVLSVNAEEVIDDRIKIITDLGIIIGDESSELMLDKNITRAEIAMVVCRLRFGDMEARPDSQVFADVDVNHWAAGQIELLYRSNIISGDGDGNFRPKDNVCTSELYKMLLNIAGYSHYMSTKGSYPENVMLTAEMVDLNKGMNLPADKVLTREEAFIIVYNLLNVETVAVVGGAAGDEYEQGEIFLNQHLRVYEGVGTLTGADNICADGKELGDGLVMIDNTIYENKAGVTAESIGLSGKIYYTWSSNDELVLLSFVPHVRNDVLEILSKDIVSYNSNQYTYIENNKTKTAKINPAKDIYYNGHTVLSEIYTVDVPRIDANGDPVIDNRTGVQIIDKVEKSYMNPTYGKIKLIDNDNNGIYDTVMIEEYQNMLCDYVSEGTEAIYGKIDGKDVSVSLRELEEYVIVNEQGANVALRNIKKDTLISLQYYDNFTGLKVIVYEDTVEGNISGVGNSDSGETVLTVDGKKYSISQSNATNGMEIRYNSNVVLYFDIFGNVGAMTYMDSKTAWKYGFILAVACNTANEFEPVIVKLVDPSGTVYEYECANKLKVDSLIPDRATIKAKLTYGTVIRYRLNGDNKVSMIDTPASVDITVWDATVSENDTLLERVARGTKICKTSNKAFYSGKSAVFYDTDTKFLYVTDLASNETYKDGTYAARTASQLVHKGIYSIAAYNTDPAKITADLIIIYENIDSEVNGADAMLVKSIEQVLNKNEELTYQLTGLYAGQNVSYTLKNPEMIDIGNHRIRPGDAVKIRVISKEITNIRLVYSPDDPYAPESIMGPGKVTTTSTNWDAEAKYEFGWIERVENPNVVFKREVNSSTEYPYSFYNAVDYFKIYIYDESNPRDPVSLGTINDIKTRSNYPGDYDTALLGVQSSNGQVMILYRD